MNEIEFRRQCYRALQHDSETELLPAGARLRLQTVLALTAATGELAGMFERGLRPGYHIDKVNVLDTAGTIMHHLGVLLSMHNSSFDKVMRGHYCKMAYRHPEQFDLMPTELKEMEDEENERDLLEKIFRVI